MVYFCQTARLEKQISAVRENHFHILLDRRETLTAQAHQKIIHEKLTIVHSLEVWALHGRASAPFNLPRWLSHPISDPFLQAKMHAIALALRQERNLLPRSHLHAPLEILQRLSPVVFLILLTAWMVIPPIVVVHRCD